MKFINKWYFIIWIIVIVVSFFFASSFATLCWDGLDINEEKLMQDCKVTPEEYWQQMEINNSFCPEGQESFRPIGGCGPDWGIVGVFVIFTSIIYNILYAVVYFILRKRKQ